jgi:NADH pyrophosphatase NudC (nudix superfamily)
MDMGAVVGFCNGCGELLNLNEEGYCEQCSMIHEREFAENKALKDMEDEWRASTD